MSLSPTTPTPEQQRLLDRMHAQRQRLVAWRAQQRQASSSGQGHVGAALLSSALTGRLAWFVRQHPLAVAACAGLAWAAGPQRLARWAGVLLPLLLRLRG
ncbi:MULTISPECIES: hypothetical protein [Giesbergeria]|uniref:YqjK-like protein n=1 Tax=Giesbergeria sinuosa TaxID=80883 RepID=A0ABV9QG78_9BURK